MIQEYTTVRLALNKFKINDMLLRKKFKMSVNEVWRGRKDMIRVKSCILEKMESPLCSSIFGCDIVRYRRRNKIYVLRIVRI